MIVQNLKFPFDHTIAYNFFTPQEISDIFDEKNKLLLMGDSIDFINDNDIHHKKLITEQNVQTYNVDKLIPNGKIKKYTHKIYDYIKTGVVDFSNLNLKYLTIAKRTDTYVNVYKNGSQYLDHQDDAVLTALYIFWDGHGTKNGGDFYFSEYQYVPHMNNNSCIIFPSFLLHGVTQLECDETLSRVTINQRFYV